MLIINQSSIIDLVCSKKEWNSVWQIIFSSASLVFLDTESHGHVKIACMAVPRRSVVEHVLHELFFSTFYKHNLSTCKLGLCFLIFVFSQVSYFMILSLNL